MSLLANGGRPNLQKLDQLYSIYSLALGVIENGIDVLEALWRRVSQRRGWYFRGCLCKPRQMLC